MIKVFVGNNIDRRPVIISEETTLRKALEDAHIDYSVGMTTLDGATLKAGELDKTFAEFGVTEQCYLLNTAKAVNAATIKVVGNIAVIESAFSPEEIAEVSKYRPNALVKVDAETKEPVFVVGVGRGDGSLSIFGAEFGSGKNAANKALITLRIPDGIEPKKYIEDKVGVSILALNSIEEGLTATLEAIKEEKAAVMATVEIL